MKMNVFKCEDIQPHLVEYVRGRSGIMHQRIDSHVSKCDRCREWTEILQSINAAIPEHPHEPNTSLSVKMAQVIERAELRANPTQWGRKLSAISAAALVSLIVLFGDLIPDLTVLVNWAAKMEWYQTVLTILVITGGFFLVATPLLAFLPSHATE